MVWIFPKFIVVPSTQLSVYDFAPNNMQGKCVKSSVTQPPLPNVVEIGTHRTLLAKWVPEAAARRAVNIHFKSNPRWRRARGHWVFFGIFLG